MTQFILPNAQCLTGNHYILLVHELDSVFIASTITLLQQCEDRLHGLICLTEPVDNNSTTSNANSHGEDNGHYKF